MDTNNRFTLTPESFRASMLSFWNESFNVQPAKGDALVIAPPVMMPDGLQVCLWLEPFAQAAGKLTDRGRTLQWLFDYVGELKDDGRLTRLLDQRLAMFGIVRDGLALEKPLPLPGDPAEVQLFSEALADVARIAFLKEPAQLLRHTASESIAAAFNNRNIPYESGRELLDAHGRTQRVDFFSENTVTGIVVFDRMQNQVEKAEAWGYRWRVLKECHARLRSAVVYDETRFGLGEHEISRIIDGLDFCCPTHRLDELCEFVAIPA